MPEGADTVNVKFDGNNIVIVDDSGNVIGEINRGSSLNIAVDDNNSDVSGVQQQMCSNSSNVGITSNSDNGNNSNYYGGDNGSNATITGNNDNGNNNLDNNTVVVDNGNVCVVGQAAGDPKAELEVLLKSIAEDVEKDKLWAAATETSTTAAAAAAATATKVSTARLWRRKTFTIN